VTHQRRLLRRVGERRASRRNRTAFLVASGSGGTCGNELLRRRESRANRRRARNAVAQLFGAHVGNILEQLNNRIDEKNK
jgi:hypothetical protein